jgi:MFS family permease
MAIGGVLLFLGYFLIKVCYVSGFSYMPLLALSLLLVGAGSSFSFSPVVKCAALNFPHARGFATSIPMAAIGLSAFVISTAATIIIPGDTEGFLSLLAFLPASLFIICINFVKFLPPTYIPARKAENGGTLYHEKEIDHGELKNQPDLHGVELLKNRTFLLHFCLMGLVSGVGQMYIYSCGYCVRALAGSEATDTSYVQSLQSLQVAIISIGSFSGRLSSGILSDYLYSRYRLQRSWLLLGAGVLSLLAQFSGLWVSSVSKLWIVSMITGLAYGMCYGSYPTIISDTFGMRYFSQNWGILAISPLVFSYMFNMMFGHYYDLNSSEDDLGHHVCLKGIQCYYSSFKVTAFAVSIAIVLTLDVIRTNSRK